MVVIYVLIDVYIYIDIWFYIEKLIALRTCYVFNIPQYAIDECIIELMFTCTYINITYINIASIRNYLSTERVTIATLSIETFKFWN